MHALGLALLFVRSDLSVRDRRLGRLADPVVASSCRQAWRVVRPRPGTCRPPGAPSVFDSRRHRRSLAHEQPL